ncbi:MAG: EscU/YscU/HrcU family type III secretion system export apparatus switch protein [Deltaproteobacteria bacterium]|nr:EscU/YscU/HrcU family type III secretion system export apparatus switch protein [Deltaproteobacteria bacterium]
MAPSASENRTEEPTERRLARARRDGYIPLSRELIAGLAFAGVCAALVAGGRAWAGGLTAYLRTALASATTGASSVNQSLKAGLQAMCAAVWLPLAVACLVALLAGVAQTRGSCAMRRVRADAGRLLPSLARILGRGRSLEAAVDLGKIGLLCAIGCWSLYPCVSALPALPGAEPVRVLAAVGTLAERLAVCLAFAMVGLGFADYLWQVARHRNRLRMTRDEARREIRESEGDPEHKAERRRLHLELQTAGTLAHVSHADLLLIEPGVAAAAISWAGAGESAPSLLVRGERLRARAIETAARAARVPSFVAPALVRALALVEEGSEIPEALYPAVAELLARARRLCRGRGTASGRAASVGAEEEGLRGPG